MDCCNYVPYRQPYYGGAYYDHLSYPGDFYGHPYHEYGGYGGPPSPYYAQPWACAAPLTDYVYSPKEARIRKGMREASRERTLGSASMTGARNSGRRPPAWMPGPEDPLMMTPPQSLRGPLCSSSFPMPSDPGPFMSMNGYNSKVGHMIPPTSDAMHPSTTYMQPIQQNPMVGMQHEPNMWQGYQDVINSRPTSGYMIPDIPTYQQQQQHQQLAEQQSTEHKSQVEPHAFSSCTMASEEKAKDNDNEQQKLLIGESVYRGKVELEENIQAADQFLPVFADNVLPYSGAEEIKMKKPPVAHNMRHKTSIAPPPKPSSKPLPDFNEAFGSTERGRFQSPPDPRLGPNKGYLDYFFDNSPMKYSDYQI